MNYAKGKYKIKTEKETILQYRQTLRQLLSEVGIASNPGVTDDWILEQVALVMKK